MKLRMLVLSMICLGSCHRQPFSLNKIDPKGRPIGRWKVYYPGTNQIYYKAKYRSGIPRGKMKYYYMNGALYRLEDYRKIPQVTTYFYYPNGKLELSGKATLTENADTSLYQWYGPWQKYDSLGNHIEERTYLRGNLIWVRKIKTGN